MQISSLFMHANIRCY